MISFPQLGKMGRWGNCLFQIATTVATAIERDEEVGLPADFPWRHVLNFPQEWFRSDLHHSSEWREPKFSYAPIPHEKDMALHGYFQSERYFKRQEKTIRAAFGPDRPAQRGTCAIHVRRGDYLDNPAYHGALPMSYYMNAVDTLTGRAAVTDWIVFSDDIMWCREKFMFAKFIDLPWPGAFQMMRFCDYHIIANSAFSWWAAWLRNNQDVPPICPDPSAWFGPLGPKDTQDILPAHWKRVKVTA